MKEEKDQEQQNQPSKRQATTKGLGKAKPDKTIKNSNTSSQSDATSPTIGGTGGGITNIRTGKDAEESSDKRY